MNVHAIIGPYVAAINPMTTGSVLTSAGFTTSANGRQEPAWQRADDVQMQVQALTGDDLKLMDGVVVSSLMRAVYLNGNIEGVDRQAGRGGDILLFQGAAWLVTQVLEPWDANGWTKVVVTKQGASTLAGQPALVPLLKTAGAI